MNTKTILKQSHHESNQLLLKFFKVLPFFSCADMLLMFVLKGKLAMVEALIAMTIVISLIPVLYYKYSKKHKYFFIISLICIEAITFFIYVSSWFYGSLFLIASLLVCILYLDAKTMTYLFIAKIPLIVLENYLAYKVNSEFIFTSNKTVFIASCSYYILELMIVWCICSYVAKKTIGVFDTFVGQNANLNTLLSKNQKSTESINQTITNLSNNIHRNSIGVESIVKSSTHISAKAQNMTDKAVESKTAFESISHEIQDNSCKSNEIYELTQQMSILTEENKENMQALTSQMHDLKNENQKCKEQFSGLKASTSEISNALKIINEVSEETNLISLNASIEAARAGESGKSFGVVASEIKKLATQTAHSVQYIEQVIRRVDSSMESSVIAINHTDQMIEHSMNKLLVALEDFDKLANFQQKISNTVSESQLLIQDLQSHVTEVSDSINGTMMDSQDTSNSILEISSILEEMSVALNEINNDAQEVRAYSNELVNIKLN